MKLHATHLAMLTATVMLALTSVDASPQGDQPGPAKASQKVVIYVPEQGIDGAFRAVEGTLEKLRCNELTLNASGEKHLYLREAVYRAEGTESLPEAAQSIIDECWSDETSLQKGVGVVAASLNTVPLLGPIVVALDAQSSSVRILLTIIIAIGVLVYAAYQAYEKFVIANHMRDLSINKLSMEVTKLRHELRGLGIRGSAPGADFREEAEVEDVGGLHLPFEFDMPEVHIWKFIKYTIFGMTSDEDRAALHATWTERWTRWRERPVHRSWLFHGMMGAGLYALSAVIGLLGLEALVVALFALIDPQEFGGLPTMIFCLILLLVAFRYCHKFYVTAGVMRRTRSAALSSAA